MLVQQMRREWDLLIVLVLLYQLLEQVRLMVLLRILLVIGFIVRVILRFWLVLLERGGAVGVVGLFRLPNNLFQRCCVRCGLLG